MTLFACMCNQPQRLSEALLPARAALVAPAPVARWGFGYVQGGEVLLTRTPRVSQDPVDFLTAIERTPSDCVIGHAVADAGYSGTDNTPPFRFRRWMYAQSATAKVDDVWPIVVDRLPDFLRRNIRGRTAGEVTFHVLLAMLHDLGVLDEANLPLPTTRRSLAAALALVSNELTKAGSAGRLGNCAVSNSRSLLVARVDEPLYLRRLWVKGERTERDPTFRGILLVSRPDPVLGTPAGEGFEEVPVDHAVLVSRDVRVDIVPLES